jgi:uncharacterized membrane protein
MNDLFYDEDIELPVIFTLVKYKMNRRTKDPILDKEGQPIIISTKEQIVKHSFKKENITIVAQAFNDSKLDKTLTEVFDKSSGKSFTVKVPYNKVLDMVKLEDPIINKIGFRYKNRK